MSASSGEAGRWFYVREGRRHGPVEITRLVELVLGGEVPEDALVWHSGLPEWLRAQDVEEIRRELPPPLPTTPGLAPPDPVPNDATESSAPDDAEALEGADIPSETSVAADPEGSANDLKRRRKRKHRHRDSKRRPNWLWPLVVVLVGLMIFLWWLLRRMNDVPPGRIIQTGSLQGRLGTDADLPPPGPAIAPRSAASRESAPASPSALPA
jgi:hypothetical protein